MSDTSLIARTDSGPVQGFEDTFPISRESRAADVAEGKSGDRKPVRKWLGIPYAQAGRWERPTKPEAWEEVRKCWDYGTIFPQPPSMATKYFGEASGFFERETKFSEDSFTVNVYASSSIKPGDKVPVLVWIYGGALNNGYCFRLEHDPTEWIRREDSKGRPIVLVAANYRTNAFGFLASKDLKEVDPQGLAGNYGLYDQVAFLEWVQTNISSFGGDPNNVTAFGESAGGFSIAQLLVSGKKLFHRAILQSGFFGTMSTTRPDKEPKMYGNILKELNVNGETAKERIEALRHVPVQDLLAASLKSLQGEMWGISLEDGEGAIWKEPAIHLIAKGKWDPWISEVILGTNEDEGTPFALNLQAWKADNYAALIQIFPESLREYVKRIYPLKEVSEGEQVPYKTLPVTKMLANSFFEIPGFWTARTLATTPNSVTGKPVTVYYYRLRTDIHTMSELGRQLGVIHSLDLPFVFNSKILWREDPNVAEQATSDILSGNWTDFAYEGKPSTSIWQPFDASNPSWLVFEPHGKVGYVPMDHLSDQEIGLWTPILVGKADALVAAGEAEVKGASDNL